MGMCGRDGRRRGCYEALEQLYLVEGSFRISQSRFHDFERDVVVQPMISLDSDMEPVSYLDRIPHTRKIRTFGLLQAT